VGEGQRQTSGWHPPFRNGTARRRGWDRSACQTESGAAVAGDMHFDLLFGWVL